MTDVRIRAGEPSDAREIAEVHVRGWRWGYRNLLPAEVLDSLSVERREHGWVEILNSLPSGATVFVAVDADRIVGFAGVGPSRDDDAPEATGELSSLYIEEEVAGTGADGVRDRVLSERGIPRTHALGSRTELPGSALLRSGRPTARWSGKAGDAPGRAGLARGGSLQAVSRLVN